MISSGSGFSTDGGVFTGSGLNIDSGISGGVSLDSVFSFGSDALIDIGISSNSFPLNAGLAVPSTVNNWAEIFVSQCKGEISCVVPKVERKVFVYDVPQPAVDPLPNKFCLFVFLKQDGGWPYCNR